MGILPGRGAPRRSEARPLQEAMCTDVPGTDSRGAERDATLSWKPRRNQCCPAHCPPPAARCPAEKGSGKGTRQRGERASAGRAWWGSGATEGNVGRGRAEDEAGRAEAGRLDGVGV